MADRYEYDHRTGEGQKRLMLESMGREYSQKRTIATSSPGDYGCDPIGDGTFRMVPSGDVVEYDEMKRRPR